MNYTQDDLFGFGEDPKFRDPNARNTDPETSHEAANDATFHASFGRLLVLKTLHYHGPMADYELALRTEWQLNSINKRRGECADAGLVEAVRDGEGNIVRRKTPSGSSARIWGLTYEGRKYLESL